MPAKPTASILFTAICSALMLLPLAGCKKETAPTYTSPDAIEQFLNENPEEAYSSDASSEEMTNAENDNDG